MTLSVISLTIPLMLICVGPLCPYGCKKGLGLPIYANAVR